MRTLPFAGLARAGFIAVQFLQSLIRVGVFTSDDYERFMSSLTTVSSEMQVELNNGKEEFLKQYGHLRPVHIISYQTGMTNHQIIILIGATMEIQEK